MTYDPSTPPVRGRSLRPKWLHGLLRPHAVDMTHVSELPPRLLEDIGFNRDLVDVLQRHRR